MLLFRGRGWGFVLAYLLLAYFWATFLCPVSLAEWQSVWPTPGHWPRHKTILLNLVYFQSFPVICANLGPRFAPFWPVSRLPGTVEGYPGPSWVIVTRVQAISGPFVPSSANPICFGGSVPLCVWSVIVAFLWAILAS